MKPEMLLALLGAGLLASLLGACAINETEIPPLGAIRVTAMDTSQVVAVEEARVLVNDVPRAQSLPAVIGGLPAGEVTVTLRPGLAYPTKTLTATVVPPETTEVRFYYSANEVIASVTVSCDESDAVIVIDEQFEPELAIGQMFNLPAGEHSISVFKPGYINVDPAAVKQEFGGEVYAFDMILEQGVYGNTVAALFPDFTFPDDWGGAQTLGQYRGQVVLLTFWFYDCVPCRNEFPFIEHVYEDRAVDGFRVLGVNLAWYNDTQEDFEAIRDQLSLTFPLLFNTNGANWTLSDLAIQTAPTNFVIAPNGLIANRVGQVTEESLNQMIDDALGP